MKSLTRTPFMTQGLALEMIEFQDHSFHEQLTSLYEDLKKTPRADMATSEAALAIEKAIFDRTGVLIEFTMNEGGAYCLPPILDKNNPLLSNLLREFYQHSTPLKLIQKAKDGMIRGKIDLVHAKVSGVFSEIKCVLNMPKSWMGRIAGFEFTPAELSAITLHEIGHIFTGFEYLTRSVTTNQVLAAVVRAMEGNDTNEQEIVITSAANVLRLDEKKLKELVAGKDANQAALLVLRETVMHSASEIGSSLYDENNWEQLADQFCARFGAQRDMITGLDKTMRAIGDISTRSTAAYVGLEIVKLTLMLSTPAIVFVAPVFAIVPLFVWTSLILFDNPTDRTYDRPGHRLMRIRDQIVMQLKDRDLGKDMIKRLHDDLNLVDDLLKNVKDRYTLVNAVFTFMSSEGRSLHAQEKLARELENFAANELYVKAAELKTVV